MVGKLFSLFVSFNDFSTSRIFKNLLTDSCGWVLRRVETSNLNTSYKCSSKIDAIACFFLVVRTSSDFFN